MKQTGEGDDDRDLMGKLAEFAKLQLELDRRAGSITGLQLFTLVIAFLFLRPDSLQTYGDFFWPKKVITKM